MNKTKSDTRVKKTLLRNYEVKVKQSTQNRVAYDEATYSSNSIEQNVSSSKECDLRVPSLCSSEAIASYLADAKKAAPPPLSTKDLNVAKEQISSKVTKKLNFHFKDKMYKNLVELNGSIEEMKIKKDKRPSSSKLSLKRDLEPNIEDFCEDKKIMDSPPTIPISKPKFKPIRKVEDGRLHKLVASFEDL